MAHGGGFIALAFPAVALGGPLLLGLAGLVAGRSRRGPAPRGAAAAIDPMLTLDSSLLYVLAFNLVFFIQELFLVLPKALVPGLRPTLYHNNHRWEGDDPLAALFQGTGAAAVLLTGIAAVVLLRFAGLRSGRARLFWLWIAYHGLFQALPQLVVGAFVPDNDVGMAMDYLQLGGVAKAALALGALAAIVTLGLAFTRPFLGFAPSTNEIAGARGRNRVVWRVATLPAMLAIPLIIAFRVPRDAVEVIVPPIAVAVIGLAWIQANAWRAAGAPLQPPVVPRPAATLAAAIALLLVFQLVLRPGIPFY